MGIVRSLCLAVGVGLVAASAASAAAARDPPPFSSASRAVVVSKLAGGQGGDPPRPLVALGPAGRELVVYDANGAALARPLDASGRPAGRQVALWRGQVVPSTVVWVPRSRAFLVAATDERRIMVRVVSADGRPLGPTRTVAFAPGNYSAALVAGPAQTELVAWTVPSRGSHTDVDCRLIDASGRAHGRVIRLARTSQLALVATVLRDGHSAFRVVWTGDTGAFSRIVDGHGVPHSPAATVRGRADPSLGYLFTGAGRAGGYITVYPTRSLQTDATGLGVRRFSSRLQPLGRPLKLLDTPVDMIALPGSIVCSPTQRRCLAAWTTKFFPYSLPTSPGPPPEAQGAQLNLDHASPTAGGAASIADVAADPADGALNPALLRLGPGKLLLAWAGGKAPPGAGATPHYEIFTRILRVTW